LRDGQQSQRLQRRQQRVLYQYPSRADSYLECDTPPNSDTPPDLNDDENLDGNRIANRNRRPDGNSDEDADTVLSQSDEHSDDFDRTHSGYNTRQQRPELVLDRSTCGYHGCAATPPRSSGDCCRTKRILVDVTWHPMDLCKYSLLYDIYNELSVRAILIPIVLESMRRWCRLHRSLRRQQRDSVHKWYADRFDSIDGIPGRGDEPHVQFRRRNELLASRRHERHHRPFGHGCRGCLDRMRDRGGADARAHVHGDSHTDANSHADVHAHVHTDAHGDEDGSCDSDAYFHTDSNTNEDTDSDADSDTEPCSVCSAAGQFGALVDLR